jgi:hypothetical protein
MCRKHFILIFAVLIMIPLFGCGLENVMPSKELPPLDGYSTVLLASFSIGEPGNYDTELPIAGLPIMVSYGVGNKLEVRHTDRSWIYDKSQDMSPVSKKVKELNLSISDLYQDPAAAVKLAKAFQADIAIVGHMEAPKFTIEETGKMKYVMEEMTPTGTARYYTVYQKAILPANVKIIEVESGQQIWDGIITGYTKYETDYRTGSPRKLVRETKMLADVRKDLVVKISDKIYPAKAKAAE